MHQIHCSSLTFTILTCLFTSFFPKQETQSFVSGQKRQHPDSNTANNTSSLDQVRRGGVKGCSMNRVRGEGWFTLPICGVSKRPEVGIRPNCADI